MSAPNGAAIRGRSAINHAFAADRRRATTCGPYAIASTRWSLVARRRLRRARGQVAACASTVISVDRIEHPFASRLVRCPVRQERDLTPRVPRTRGGPDRSGRRRALVADMCPGVVVGGGHSSSRTLLSHLPACVSGGVRRVLRV